MIKLKFYVLTLLALALSPMLHSQDSNFDETWVEHNRHSIIQTILGRIQAEAEAKEYRGWVEELSLFLNDASSDKLFNAYQARNFKEVVNAIQGERNYLTQAYNIEDSVNNSNKLLGDTFEDLVFTPLTPCRIVDTRVQGGKFNAMQTRSYSVNGDTSSQGGALSCGVPVGLSEPPAVILNVTSTGGESNGYLTAWEVGESRPLASILNFQSSDIANSSIVPTGLGQTDEIQIFASSRTHVIIDIIGYLRKPELTVPVGVEYTNGVSDVTLVGGLGRTTVDSISVAMPSAGHCVVNASGFVQPPFDTGPNRIRCGILDNEFSNDLLKLGYVFFQDTESRTFSQTRGFAVDQGNTTFRLICHDVLDSVSFNNPSLTAACTPNRY